MRDFTFLTRRRSLVFLTACALALAGIVTVSDASPANATWGAMIVPAAGHITGNPTAGHCNDGSSHNGVDIAQWGGSSTVVVAAAAGTVETIATSPSFGQYIVIDHGAGYKTTYAHLVTGSSLVATAQTVSAGQQIATMGSTGNSSGTHLHFELRLNGSIPSGWAAMFSCGTDVSRGSAIAWSFPGLSSSGTAPRLITPGDWDGDGLADLLHIDGGNFYMYRGDGNGGFLSGAGTLIGSSWNSFNRVISPGDWDGDGLKDLLAIANNGYLYLYRGNGTGGFLGNSVIGNSWNSFTTVVAPGDFSGDGHPDLLALAGNGDLYLYPGNGTGGFLGASAVGSGWAGFTSLTTPGDWNGDGHVDVLGIVPNFNLYMNTGDGAGHWSSVSVPIGSGWSFREVSGSPDFSGDGIPDLFGITSSGALYIYRGDGTGHFSGNSLVSASGW